MAETQTRRVVLASGEVRAACMEACRDALRDPSDIAIIGRVAEAIRALPLDGGAT